MLVKKSNIRSLSRTRRQVEKELEEFAKWFDTLARKKKQVEKKEKCACGAKKKERSFHIEYDWSRVTSNKHDLRIGRIVLSCQRCGKQFKVFKATKKHPIKYILEHQANVSDIKEMFFILLDSEINRALYEWRHER